MTPMMKKCKLNGCIVDVMGTQRMCSVGIHFAHDGRINQFCGIQCTMFFSLWLTNPNQKNPADKNAYRITQKTRIKKIEITEWNKCAFAKRRCEHRIYKLYRQLATVPSRTVSIVFEWHMSMCVFAVPAKTICVAVRLVSGRVPMRRAQHNFFLSTWNENSYSNSIITFSKHQNH